MDDVRPMLLDKGWRMLREFRAGASKLRPRQGLYASE
jgi:hypothetical protein